ncbi:MAG: XisI protein [Chloroflexota bacterium]
MGRIDEYRKKIQQVLTQYANYNAIPRDVDDQVIIDIDNDHYLLIRAGWYNNTRRSYGCLMHMDIINDKIWIQYDGTEAGIANELVELGVPKQDIVLAYHMPSKRKLTEFAVG